MSLEAILTIVYFVIGFIVAIVDSVKSGNKPEETESAAAQKTVDETNAAQLEMAELATLMVVIFWPVYLVLLVFHVFQKKSYSTDE